MLQRTIPVNLAELCQRHVQPPDCTSLFRRLLELRDQTELNGELPALIELDAFLAGDPYAKAGLFASVTVLPYKKVLP